MGDELPNGLVVSDSSKLEAVPGAGYDIKTFEEVKGNALLSKISKVVTGAQLFSLFQYLRHLAQAAQNAETIIPKLLLVAQLIEHSTTISDLTISLTGQILCKKASRPKRRIYGNNVPGVDVIITVCKEDVDIVMDTVRAAATLDWPAEKLRVVVSDDGVDADLKDCVEDLSKRYSHVHYYSRPKIPGKHHGFKAGNMNQAIRYLTSDALQGPTHEYIACLDADMIPNAKWLRAMVPHMLVDEDIGMIATPQDFYNIPVNDPLHENLHLQHEAEQNLRDRMGAAWCVGSGFLVKRSAWADAGGFSETSMCDDVLFGWTLNGRGFKTASIKERLQQGMQPSSFVEHIKQRRRWYIGGIQNAREVKYGLDKQILGKSSAWQKLATLNQIPKPYMGTIGKLMSWLLIGACVISGRNVIDTQSNGWLTAHIFGEYAIYTVATRVSEYMLASNGFGIQNIRRRQIVSTWQGIHLSKAALQEVVPSWLGGCALPFVVTGVKAVNVVDCEERDQEQRPGMVERLRRLNQIEHIFVHFYNFLVIGSALVVRGIWTYNDTNGEASPLLTALALTVLFPGMKMENLVCFLSPIWYTMFPPTEKAREKYLTEDEDTGFRRPLLWECGARFTRGMYVWEAWYLLATAWAIVAWWLVASEVGLI